MRWIGAMIMARIENWNTELREWLSPFLQKLGHKVIGPHRVVQVDC